MSSLARIHRSLASGVETEPAACDSRAVERELRIYTLRPGTLDEFVFSWRREVLPLRARYGFEVLGAWSEPERYEFVWELGYGGEEGLREGERRYAAARALLTFEYDPADYVASVQVRFLLP